MSEHKDSIPTSQIRIQASDATSMSDALYSNPVDETLSPASSRMLTPRFYPVEGISLEGPSDNTGNSGTLERRRRNDSVSTGTFGNLVKRASIEQPENEKEERVSEARQRIRFNLLRVGPKKTKGDRCVAWRKYLF